MSFAILLLLANPSVSQQTRIISTGSAGIYSITYPGYFSLKAGQEFTFEANHTNTGPASLNVSATGNLSITKHGSVSLAAGDIVSGQMVKVIYDGTKYQMISTLGSSVSSTSWSLNGNAGINSATNFLGTTDGADLVFKTSSVERMRLTNPGQFGIGTASPQATLHLENANPTLRMKSTQSNSFASSILSFGRDDGLGNYVETGFTGHMGAGDFLTVGSPYAIYFTTNFSERMVITNSGNIGINNSSPAQALDIVGNLQLSNAFMPGFNPGNVGELLFSQGPGNAPIWMTAGTLNGGTLNYIPKWSSTTSLSPTSLLYDNGTAVGVNTTTPGSTLSVNGGVSVGSTYATVNAPANGLLVEGKVGVGTTGIGNDLMTVYRNNGIVGAGYSNIFAFRAGNSGIATSGTNWGNGGVDAAIKGLSNWGNNYSAGIVGYNYLTDYDYTAAVIGSDHGATVFGALAYRGLTSSEIYAGYFNGRVRTTGQFVLDGPFMPNNNAGTSGQVLTSSGAGSPPQWSAPSMPTASNGLTMVGTTVNLGGTLTQNTTVNMNAYSLFLTGSNSSYFGIKTTTPASTLHVHEISGVSQFRITNNVTGSTGGDGFSISSGGSNALFMMQHENADFSLSTNSFTNLVLKPNGNVGVATSTAINTLTVGGSASVGNGYLSTAAPANGLLVEGNVGVGSTNPGFGGLYQAQVTGLSKRVISVSTTAGADDAPAILELKGSGLTAGDEIGVIDFTNRVSGQDYNFARIAAEWRGTNVTYAGLSFSTRNGASLVERMLIDETGLVNISGSINLTGGSTSEIRRSNSGTANLIPIAYGCISSTGAIFSGTGNFTVTKTAVGEYTITITGFSFNYSTYITNLTLVGVPGFVTGNSLSGNLIVETSNVSGTATDRTFYFTVFKP